MKRLTTGELEPSGAPTGAPRSAVLTRNAARALPIERFRSIDFLGLLGIGFLVGVWLAITLVTSRTKVPMPSDVVSRLADDFFTSPLLVAFGVGESGYATNLLYTVENVVVAITIGSTVGIIVGLVSARMLWFRTLIDPFVIIGGTIPIIVAVPFFLVWFGTGRWSAVLLVVVYSTVILIVFAQRAAENLDPVYEQSARTLGADRERILRTVLAPGTMPEILGGIRIAFAGAWGLAAISELLGLPSGIGKIVQVLATTSDTEGIFAAVLLLSVTAIVLDGMLAFGMRVMFRWRG